MSILVNFILQQECFLQHICMRVYMLYAIKKANIKRSFINTMCGACCWCSWLIQTQTLTAQTRLPSKHLPIDESGCLAGFDIIQMCIYCIDVCYNMRCARICTYIRITCILAYDLCVGICLHFMCKYKYARRLMSTLLYCLYINKNFVYIMYGTRMVCEMKRKIYHNIFP